MRSPLANLKDISILKTLRVNFTYLSPKDAMKLPILISRQTRLRKVKGRVIFHCPLRSGLVKFGFDTLGLVDYGRDRAVWEVDGTVEFNGAVRFGAATKLIVLGGKLMMGSHISITGLSRLLVYHSVRIGNDCLISWDVQIMDTDMHSIYNDKGERINKDREINIGDHTWIGCKVLLLKGANIPSDSIVAAGSIISKSLEDRKSIYGGNPICLLKSDINWEI